MGLGLVLLSPSLAHAAPSALRKGPYLQDLGPASVSIRLELDPPGRAAVEIEPIPSESPDAEAVPAKDAAAIPAKRRIAGKATAEAFQAIRVDQLQPKTPYRYRIVVLDGATEVRPPEGEGRFTTAPAPGQGDLSPFGFIVYGDNRTDDAAHAAVARAVARGTGDFIVHTGDFVENGANELQWQRFFEVERAVLRDRCLFGSVGNHELIDSGGDTFLRYFGGEKSDGAPANDRDRDRRRYARTVQWGSARFFFLNAMDTFTSTEERKWVEAELARSDAEPGITFRFVVLHHGPYSSGPHGNNPRLWNTGMVDLLKAHHIDLVWSGHDHIFERGEAKGLKYVVSGGGGAPLYPIRKRLASARVAESAHHFVEVKIEGQRIDLTTKRLDGSVLDRCGFSKGGHWDCDKVAVTAPSQAAGATPSTPPPSPSRCGCTVPGASPFTRELALATCALAMATLRRRRRRTS